MENKPKETTKSLRIPNGDLLAIKVPPPPERNTKNFVIGKCRFHIPLPDLEAQLAKNIWPITKVTEQPLGTNSIPADQLWLGKKEEWSALLKQERENIQTKRVDKIRTIRACQTALRKLTKADWEALGQIFSIQRQFFA